MKRRFKHGSKLATEIAEAYERSMKKRGLFIPKKWGKPNKQKTP